MLNLFLVITYFALAMFLLSFYGLLKIIADHQIYQILLELFIQITIFISALAVSFILFLRGNVTEKRGYAGNIFLEILWKGF